MATDVDVQYFSHLNGLVLGNNWGDLIRLLDKALVTGVNFTQITAASIDAQGDIHITLFAAHNAMLFQVVELTGFAPSSLNQKYRIKGVPNATQLILKPHTSITETSITTVGAGKLASLGYDIIFRDTGDVKRVYRAKNPTTKHPFIRVDETISDGVNSYNATYAKFAMVGLLENMEHIDDYLNQNVLQLPFDPTDLTKNWKISGTGDTVTRGWSRWYVARQGGSGLLQNSLDGTAAETGNRKFTLVGDKDAFYILQAVLAVNNGRMLQGCGLINDALSDGTIPNWFLIATLTQNKANVAISLSEMVGGTALAANSNIRSQVHLCKYDQVNRLQPNIGSNGIMPDYTTGLSKLYPGNGIAALELPLADTSGFLRGTLKHIHYAGGDLSGLTQTTPILNDSSMYVADKTMVTANLNGGFYFYLGELE